MMITTKLQDIRDKIQHEQNKNQLYVKIKNYPKATGCLINVVNMIDNELKDIDYHALNMEQKNMVLLILNQYIKYKSCLRETIPLWVIEIINSLD